MDNLTYVPSIRYCQFIGGSHDGAKIGVDVNKEFWKLEKLTTVIPGPEDSVEMELYQRTSKCNRDGRWFEYNYIQKKEPQTPTHPRKDEPWYVQLPGDEEVKTRYVVDITARTVCLRGVCIPIGLPDSMTFIPLGEPSGGPFLRLGDVTRYLRKDIQFIELAMQELKYFVLEDRDD